MHETMGPIQVAFTVATTVGVGGVMYAAGNLLGRRGDSNSARPSEIVTDNRGESRFEIRLDGELVGFTEYRVAGAVVDFHHTEIDPRFRGRGLAGKLIAFALDASRSAGLSVRPSCPFVRAFIDNHRDPSFNVK